MQFCCSGRTWLLFLPLGSMNVRGLMIYLAGTLFDLRRVVEGIMEGITRAERVLCWQPGRNSVKTCDAWLLTSLVSGSGHTDSLPHDRPRSTDYSTALDPAIGFASSHNFFF